MLHTVRRVVAVLGLVGLVGLAVGCRRTPGIDQPIDVGNGATIQVTSAKILTSIPGHKFEVTEVDGPGGRQLAGGKVPSPDMFRFVKVTAQLQRTRPDQFDAMSICLNGAWNADGRPAQTIISDGTAVLELTYIVMAENRGPFNLRLPNGQLIPLDRFLK